MTTGIVKDQHPTNKHDAPTPGPEPDDTKRDVSPVRQSAEHAELAKVAEELWRQLARDMKAAREDGSIPASKWGLPSNWDRVSPLEDSQKVNFSRTHLSNVENRRGGAKPTPLIAELYDNWFTRPRDPDYFRRLQKHAAAADDRAKKSKQKAEHGVPSRPVARHEQQRDNSEHAARHQLRHRTIGLGLVACTVLALAAFGPRLIGDRKELTRPDRAHPAGHRAETCSAPKVYGSYALRACIASKGGLPRAYAYVSLKAGHSPCVIRGRYVTDGLIGALHTRDCPIGAVTHHRVDLPRNLTGGFNVYSAFSIQRIRDGNIAPAAQSRERAP